MAFNVGLFFIVATESASPTLLAQQELTDSLRDDHGSLWPQPAAAQFSGLFLGDGTNIPLSLASKTILANIFLLGAGAVAGTGHLSLNVTALTGSSVEANVMAAFASGGRIAMTIDALTLTIQLRMLHSTDYQLSGGAGAGTLTPVGIAGNNFTGVPASETASSYAFEFFSTTGVGDFSLNATAVSASNITLAATDSPPPSNAPGLTNLRITRSFGGIVDAESVLTARIHVPTELVVSYDRSGSMNETAGSSTKWLAARGVANIVSRLFANVASPLGSVASTNKIRLTQWSYSGASTFSQMPADGSWEDGNNAPQLNAPNAASGGTPIGDALQEAGATFTSARWKRRVVLLLTDGKHNSGSLNLINADIDPVFPTKTNSGATSNNRILLHTVQYAATGAGNFAPFLHDHLQDLSALAPLSLNLDSSADANPLGSDNLLDMMSEIAASVLAADKQKLTSNSVPVEADVQRVVFLATNSFTMTDAASTAHASGAASGAHWVVVDAPAKGIWTVTAAPASGSIYAFFDHALIFRAGAYPARLGEPIKLWADLRFHTRPVSGASIRLGGRRPAESVGEVITQFVRSGGLRRAVARGYFSKEFLEYLKEWLVDEPGRLAKDQDLPSLQEELLKAAEIDRNLPLQFTGNAEVFAEVSPGHYELTVAANQQQTEYSRNFYIRADGTLSNGDSYGRNRRLTVILAPEPVAEHSPSSFAQVSSANSLTTWEASITPRTVAKTALGPGLGHFVFFQYVDPALQKALPPLRTVDGLDGSYSATLVVKEGEKPPAIALTTTTYKAGDKTGFIPIKADRGFSTVKVVLKAIKILDDHDCLLKGDGEFRFRASVAPNASPTRTVTTVLPGENGHFRAGNGDIIQVRETIFEGRVEEGASLTISIAGEELDWPSFFDHNDKLARYVRTVPLESKEYAPGDECNDPESLADWEIWYEVTVHK